MSVDACPTQYVRHPDKTNTVPSCQAVFIDNAALVESKRKRMMQRPRKS